MKNLLDASCRVAFSALIHDIGKFAERAKIEITADKKERNQQVFCPTDENGYFKYTHAAYTGIAIDLIEKYLPPINNTDTFPFQEDSQDNSIIGAAAKHHKPDTYLQHIIHIADMLSSAFEREKSNTYTSAAESENYIKARLIPLFEKLFTDPEIKRDFNFRYSLSPLSPQNCFPESIREMSAQAATEEYRILWKNFISDIKKIKYKDNWELWLDNFDTLYSVYTQSIPSASYNTIPDVSLYDHSKSTAALATALWRYHYETDTQTLESLKDEDCKKFLLIQGDISGIQSFIFSLGGSTRKNAYKLLRGRSFMISLFCECAALKILSELELPATSQIMNAAGKFIIVAPDTKNTREKTEQIKKELDKWFLAHFYGEISIGISVISASQNDFKKDNFSRLQNEIFASLNLAKLQKFNLCEENSGSVENIAYDNEKGICCFCGKKPAEKTVPNSEDYACSFCADIIALGNSLVQKNSVSVSETPDESGLKTDILGFYIGFGKTENSRRCWDISLPQKDGSLFNGLARRNINAYVPRFAAEDADNPVYDGLDMPEVGKIKTFSHIARENCLVEDGNLKKKPALMCLKGDIDNLGHIMGAGVKRPTFATLAQLSRQINNFFTIWLPWFCRSESVAKNIYTVFAGGDDFYLVGPWLDMMKFVPVLHDKFAEYMCGRTEITFSLGMVMTRSGEDVACLSALAESALEHAKDRKDQNGETVKNAVCCFGEVVSFAEYGELLNFSQYLDDLSKETGLSVSYIYSLQTLCEQAQRAANGSFTDAMWRSRLVYRTARFINDSRIIPEESKQIFAQKIIMDLSNAIEKYQTKLKIALYAWLYQQREK